MTQRNEAREQSLRFEAELKQREEEIASGKLLPPTPDITAPGRVIVHAKAASGRIRQSSLDSVKLRAQSAILSDRVTGSLLSQESSASTIENGVESKFAG